jgi:predicted O-linked N-acetylglucosamine transferase (SPINDLY family)
MTSATLAQAAQLHRAGRLEEAERAYRQVTSAEPSNADAWHLFGGLLAQTGRPQAAEPMLRRAIALDGGRADFHLNLAVVLLRLSQAAEAAQACQRALALRPDWAEGWYNAGCAAGILGQWDKAISAYQRAVQLKGDYAEAYFNLGDALRKINRGDEGLECFRKAAQLRPTPQALNNLGNSLQVQDRYAEAIEAYQRALEIQPDSVNARSNLGQALLNLGRIEEAVAIFRQVTHVPFAGDNLVLAVRYLLDTSPEQVFREHRQWDQRHAQSLAPEIRPHPNVRDPSRQLRIGYVSSDFRLHSVAFFLENLLAYHDAREVEVFAYADVPQPDEITRRMRQSIHQWRLISGMNDGDVANMIRSDQIDILVDLAGHTAGNRLLVFARKPAPIQITYLGYPDTTGMSAMDYRITDGYADPPGMTEMYHSEKLLRLPRTFASYRPPEEAPEVSPLPATIYGRVTFGAFTTLAKLPPVLLDCWSEILLQVPDSRLLITAAGLQAADLQRDIRRRFESKGIDPTRVDLMGKRPFEEYFALHHRVDIYLDTFPVNGHTVTCHALWMGLPVVTLAGQTHCQRLGASVLSNLGMEGQIAKSSQEYVRIAKELAGDLGKLKDLRASLRERMKASPILDAAGFSREVEAAYRGVWKNWCELPR